jgi:predicted CopG family antitoxin
VPIRGPKPVVSIKQKRRTGFQARSIAPSFRGISPFIRANSCPFVVQNPSPRTKRRGSRVGLGPPSVRRGLGARDGLDIQRSLGPSSPTLDTRSRHQTSINFSRRYGWNSAACTMATSPAFASVAASSRIGKAGRAERKGGGTRGTGPGDPFYFSRIVLPWTARNPARAARETRARVGGRPSATPGGGRPPLPGETISGFPKSTFRVIIRVYTNKMKTITLDDEAYERLKAWKRGSRESFSSVVKRVLPDPGTLGSFLQFLNGNPTSELPGNDKMEESVGDRSFSKHDPWT